MLSTFRFSDAVKFSCSCNSQTRRSCDAEVEESKNKKELGEFIGRTRAEEEEDDEGRLGARQEETLRAPKHQLALGHTMSSSSTFFRCST